MIAMIPCWKQLFPSRSFNRFLAAHTTSHLASAIHRHETGRVVYDDSGFLADDQLSKRIGCLL